MAGHRKFNTLIEKMSPESRARVAVKAAIMDAELTLRELREHAGVTQGDLAKTLGVSQPVVSRMENQDNILLTTLENYLKAIGAELEVVAKFKNGERVSISLGDDS